MVRGERLFICDDCKKVFWGLDIEYMCTVHSYPVPCPRCGKTHTGPLFEMVLGGRCIYKSIWKHLEENDDDKNENEIMHIQ